MDGKKRHLANNINRLLNTFPAVVILGARQCGKSTIAYQVGADWQSFDLENPNHFEMIHSDPVLFFAENSEKVIIDEAQKSPQVFQVLRGVIDRNRKKNGRFILTGSASFDLIKTVSESLAGRVGIVELHPFKMDEFADRSLSKFFQIFESPLNEKSSTFLKALSPSKPIDKIKHYLLRGGYPQPVLENDSSYWLDWMQNYFDTYINRDMRSLFPRIDLIKYRRVVQMLSALSGTIVNRSEIARSVEASEKTCRDYLDIISGTYFWRDLPPFVTPKVKTTVKMPKGHFRDSGLTLFLQNVFCKEQLNVYPRLGNVFESFVVEEIIRGIEATSAKNLSFSHFRTKAGGEIDLIAEGSFGMLPIEVKLQSTTAKSSIKSMLNLIELLKLPLGIVFNNCEKPALIADKVIQIPVGCL